MSRLVWIFDLDNTLHDATPYIFPHINRSMTAYLQQHLGLDQQAASELRVHYWRRYGATLSGLMKHHGTDPRHFLWHTHQFPQLPPMVLREPRLRHVLKKLPGRKLLFSNAPQHYVHAVLRLLRVDDPRFADLGVWRAQRGLARYPDFAILSNSLDFPIPPALTSGGRKATVFTSGKPSPDRVRAIEARLGRVIVAGDQRVEGARLVQRLAELGYGTIYSSAGPQVLHALVSDGMLNRLYLTHAHRLLGGRPFASILEGRLLEPPAGMKIHHIYLDAQALGGLGQVLTSYDRVDDAVQ